MYLFSQKSFLDISRIKIMGILNITPDSFFDGGKYFKNLNKALTRTNQMILDGASIIDIGGESTRPQSKEISLDEELERIIPVIEEIIKRFDVWISVDTSKPEVMIQAINRGVHIINDVRFFSRPGALDIVAKKKVCICFSHMKDLNTESMQNNIFYKKNVITEIKNFFTKIIFRCKKKGIKENKIILDPGFGFGKNIYHNYKILSDLSKFNFFNLPILVGMSRKSMINNLLNIKKNHALIGSITCAVIASLQKGVKILRVHDVKETHQAIKIVNAILLIKGKL